MLKNKPQTYFNFQWERPPHHAFLLVEKQLNIFFLLFKEKQKRHLQLQNESCLLHVIIKENNKVSVIIYTNFSLKMNFVNKCFLVLLHSDLLCQRWTVETKICLKFCNETVLIQKMPSISEAVLWKKLISKKAFTVTQLNSLLNSYSEQNKSQNSQVNITVLTLQWKCLLALTATDTCTCATSSHRIIE